MPIALLPTLAKAAEAIMHDRLSGHITDNNLMSDKQAAYLKGDSTTQQLLYINHSIKSSGTEGFITQACFLDVSAAFDKCWVKGILAKLEQIKVGGYCHNLFKSYLTNQKRPH